MKPKKSPKPTKQDKAWQRKLEKQLKVEKLKLDYPKGKERFEQATKLAMKKKLH